MRFENVQYATTEELIALQQSELKVLKQFKQLMDQNGMSFFLSGGTLIGSLRNNGFIPWDDDIDVMMWRDDYERFYENSKKILQGTNLILGRTDEFSNQHLTGMTLKDTKTTFINKHSLLEKDVIHSIGIDIMPLDYRPVGRIRAFEQMFWAIIFSLYNADRLPDHQGKVIRYFSVLPLKIFPKKIKYKIWKFAELRMVKLGQKESQEAVELGVGLKPLTRNLKSKWFSKTILRKFEGVEMPVPVGYEEYLGAVVGNFLELPPKSDQKPKHNTVLVDTDVPYSDDLRLSVINNK